MAGTVVISTALQAQTTTELSRTTVETSLSNGLKVIIREDHRSPVVMTQIWYGVGSSDESGNLLGISHALEHMMFKGTTKVPLPIIPTIISFIRKAIYHSHWNLKLTV